MGWCGDFGTWIDSGCGSAMVAGSRSCTCAKCGAECAGKFAGCKEVWAAGPVTRRAVGGQPQADLPAPAATNGTSAPKPVPAKKAKASPPPDDRLRHLDAAVSKMADDLAAVHEKLGALQESRTADDRPAAERTADERTADERTADERVDRIEARVDGIARDLIEAIRLLRPLLPTVEAHQAEMSRTGRRVDDLGQGFQAIQSLVTQQQAVQQAMQSMVTQQQARLDKVLGAQAASSKDRSAEAVRRERPVPRALPERRPLTPSPLVSTPLVRPLPTPGPDRPRPTAGP